MKLIQQLVDALFLLLNDKDLGDTKKREQLARFYNSYVGEDRVFYQTSDVETILDFVKTKYGDELLHRVEMLSDIMYYDGLLEVNREDKKMLLGKALCLLLYLDEHGDTYSIVRQGKIENVKQELAQF